MVRAAASGQGQAGTLVSRGTGSTATAGPVGKAMPSGPTGTLGRRKAGTCIDQLVQRFAIV